MNTLLAADDVLMVPKEGRLPSRADAVLHPFIYSAPMDTATGYALTAAMLEEGEMPVLCRNISDEEWNATVKEHAHNIQFWIAIGQKKEQVADFLKKINALELPDDTQLNLAIDVAHGDSVVVHQLTKLLAELPMVRFIMSGSIATGAGAVRAVEAGCTHIRVGIGPGSACTTRLMTGCGVPQLSAIVDVYQGLHWQHPEVQIIADGGIRDPGDAAKYLGAGANGIMMGREFSKAVESRGWEQDGFYTADPDTVISFPQPPPVPKFIKRYRGHASAAYQVSTFGAANRCPEGAQGPVMEYDQYTTVKTVVEKYRGGISSAISYTGGLALTDLAPDKVNFIQVTQAGRTEGYTNFQKHEY